MRALAATTLTLAFILMAAVTYIAVHQDPMGGEPKLVVKIEPPDMAKLQAAAAPPKPTAPAEAESPAGMTVDLGAAASDATPQAAEAQGAALDAGPSALAAPAKPAATAATDPAAADAGVEGISLSLPN